MNKQELIKDILDNYQDQMYDLKGSLIALSETEIKSKEEIKERVAELENTMTAFERFGNRIESETIRQVITALKWVLGED